MGVVYGRRQGAVASLSYCPARGSPSRNTWPLRWRLDIAQDADNLQELNKAFALATLLPWRRLMATAPVLVICPNRAQPAVLITKTTNSLISSVAIFHFSFPTNKFIPRGICGRKRCQILKREHDSVHWG
jgi:hypothetical protein